MIKQQIHIDRAKWDVTILYFVTHYDADKVLRIMQDYISSIEGWCWALDTVGNLQYNDACTISKFEDRKSLIVFAPTTSADEFAESLSHEIGHLVRHLSQSMNLDPYGEQEQYLVGEVTRKMFKISKRFLCEHCRESVAEFEESFLI